MMMIYKQIVNPEEYFHKQGYTSELIELDTLWASADMLEDITMTVTELCNEEGYVDVMTIAPSVFSAGDLRTTLERIDVCDDNQ